MIVFTDLIPWQKKIEMEELFQDDTVVLVI
jgi:hypothetical protein